MSEKIPMIHGSCDTRFAAVRDAFAANFAAGLETGASFAVELDGVRVVDLWAGWTRADRRSPWQQDTIVNTYSTTKVVAALTVLMLVDRGQLDLDTPLATYWPELASAGKGDILLWHVLAHAAGLPGFKQPIAVEQLYDPKLCAERILVEEPWWQPGSAAGYHSLTYGCLLGEVVRAVTGATLGQWFQRELAQPLGADFHIGLPAADDVRVAEMIPPAPKDVPKLDPESWLFRVLTNPPIMPRHVRSRAWRGAEIPAANGHGNARSIARLAALLTGAGRGVGPRLSAELLNRVNSETSYQTDKVFGLPIRWGLGVALRSDELPVGRHSETMFWGGYGGSLLVADRVAGVSVGYAMNQMCPMIFGDPRTASLVNAVYACL